MASTLANNSIATEHTDEALPPCITSNDAAATVADATRKKQLFTKSVAQKQATKHKSMVTKDGDDDEGTMCKPKIVIEDLGGAPADLDDEDHPEDATVSKHELQMTTSIIQVGRPKDMHKEMQRVAAIFGTELDDAIKPFHIQPHENKALGITIHEALQHQKSTAETLRQQQDTEVPHEPIESDAQVQMLTEEAAELLQSIPQTWPQPVQ